jgi:putative hemolysin
MYPPDPISRLLKLISGPASPLRRLFGAPLDVDTVAELNERLRRLAAGEENDADAAHDSMLRGAFTFRDTLAREVMTPRLDVVALPLSATREQALLRMVEAGHSRIPVYDGDLDEIVGVLLLKDLVADMMARSGNGPAPSGIPADDRPLAPLLREPFFIPDSKRIGELLPELRAHIVHMAVVLDEFGGTEGIVTLEDLLEEIVGDIFDEHDEPEFDFRAAEDGAMLVDGGVAISTANERLGLDLPEAEYDTIGGFVFGTLGRVPEVDDRVPLENGAELRVEAVNERRITAVRYTPPAVVSEDA